MVLKLYTGVQRAGGSSYWTPTRMYKIQYGGNVIFYTVCMVQNKSLYDIVPNSRAISYVVFYS